MTMEMLTTAEIIYNKLQSLILTGKLKPGEKINIDELARNLNISKTPVRESLKKCEKEGFVTYSSRIGWNVSKLSKEEYMNLEEIQEMIEINLCINAIKYVELIDFKLLEKINDNIEKFIKTKQYDHIFSENEKFHMTIYEVYPNPQLLEILKNTWNKIKLQRNIMVTSPEFMKSVVQEHKAIINALKKQDKDLVNEAMWQHFKTGRAVMDSNFDKE